LRNAILLYKALKNEKLREVYICANGFETIKQRYSYYCKRRTTKMYKQPEQTIYGYPSEILPGKLYLGD
jgi:hypothetical protein